LRRKTRESFGKEIYEKEMLKRDVRGRGVHGRDVSEGASIATVLMLEFRSFTMMVVRISGKHCL